MNMYVLFSHAITCYSQYSIIKDDFNRLYYGQFQRYECIGNDKKIPSENDCSYMINVNEYYHNAHLPKRKGQQQQRKIARRNVTNNLHMDVMQKDGYYWEIIYTFYNKKCKSNAESLISM